jgi:Zn-dependent peptidase ImmA (M78 family)/DNA-binding XRE family transcriptional regulator
MSDKLQIDNPSNVLGRRLQAARQEKGATQADAAAALGMARTTLVAIEKGDRRVRPNELVALAQFYGRQVNELLRSTPPNEALSAQFRLALTAAPESSALESLIAELQSLAEDYGELERLTGRPTVHRSPSIYSTEGLRPEVAGADVAARERSRLGLGDGPILQLREILEGDVGLRVFGLKLPSSVAGLFAFVEDLGGCIGFNINHPYERQRWSLAHEYGHFATARTRAEVTILAGYRRVPANERLAEAFAQNLLMPAAGLTRRFHDILRSNPEGPTPADLVQLADLYQVSVQAMIIRLEDLRLITPGTWDQLEAAGFSPREAKKLLDIGAHEPDHESLPRQYRYLAVEAYERALITEGQLARFLRTDRLGARETVQELVSRLALTDSGEVTKIEMDPFFQPRLERPAG